MMIENSRPKPIAFDPVLKRITNSTTASLLLSYFIQHCKTTQTSEKFQKTQKELENETGLSRTEQESARKTLKALGLLKEKRTGLPCKLYFEVNVETLYKLTSDDSLLPLLKPHHFTSAKEHTNSENLKNTQISQFAETLQSSLQDSYNQVCRTPANKFAQTLQSSLQESSNQVCTNPANKDEMNNENMQKHANFAVCGNPANKYAEILQTSMQDSCNQVCTNPANYTCARAYTYTLNNSSSKYKDKEIESKDYLTWYYHESSGNTTIVELSLSSPSLYLQKSSLSSPYLPKAFSKNAFGMDASEKNFSRSETSNALVPNNAVSGESVASMVKSEDKGKFCCGELSDPVQAPVQAQPEPQPEPAEPETHSDAESGTSDSSDKAIGSEVMELNHTRLNDDLSCEFEILQNTGGERAENAPQSNEKARAAENAHKSPITNELFKDIPNIVHSGENATASLNDPLLSKRGAGRKAKSENEPKKARKTRSKGETQEEKVFRQEFFAFATKVVDWIVSRGGVKEDPACFYRWARKLAKNDKRITVEIIRACFRHYAMQTNGYGWRGKIKTFKQFMYAFNEIYQHYQTSLNILQNQNLNGGHHDLSTSRGEQSPQSTPSQDGNSESSTAVARREDSAGNTGNGEATQLLGDINTAGYDYLEWREKCERDLREYEQKIRVASELAKKLDFSW